jgi:hypothetical protein
MNPDPADHPDGGRDWLGWFARNEMSFQEQEVATPAGEKS